MDGIEGNATGPQGVAALTIAVVGHRHQRLPADQRPVADGLARLFGEIDAATTRPLILATGMAEGADLIAARARPAHWRLRAVLTQPAEACAAAMARAEDRAQLIAALAAPAASIEVLAGAPDDYVRQAGSLLDGADLLVAVWDGGTTIAAGGTADSIRRAMAGGLPVVWLPLDGTGPILLETGPPHPGGRPVSRDVLRRLCAVAARSPSADGLTA